MSHLHDHSESSGNATSRTLSNNISFRSNVSTRELKESKRRLVAHINFGENDANESLKIVRHPEQAADSSSKWAQTPPDAHTQALWIHLSANCRSWVEETIAEIGRWRSAPVDLKRKHVLRDEIWKDACNGQASKSIHARFMKPLCARFSADNLVDHDSDDSAGSRHYGTNIALYLPYLHWEDHQSWLDRQKLVLNTNDLHDGIPCGCSGNFQYSDGSCTPESEESAHQSRPLHHRRTLDHSYFYNLSNLTSLGDEQVIKSHTQDNPDKIPDMTPKMMMVDQLWLWILEDNVIVTAFPEGEKEGSCADVLQSITRELRPALEDRSIKSVNGLVSLIVSKCTGVFHQRDLPADLEFFQFFADAIGAAKNKQFRAFHRFRKSSAAMEADMDGSAQDLDSLFTINEEITLIAEVKTIINDLHKIDFVIGQQQEVLRCLEKYSKASRSIRDLCDTIEHRRNAWVGMADTATKTYESLRDLMDLKQRQANVWEARIARNQVEVTARHGRSIMLFTIVTIIFLPMSVLATIFGMNVKQLNSGSDLGLGMVSAILFPVSLIIAVLALVLAFNETLRELLLHTLRGIYRVGLRCMGMERLKRRLVRTRTQTRQADVESTYLQMHLRHL